MHTDANTCEVGTEDQELKVSLNHMKWKEEKEGWRGREGGKREKGRRKREEGREGGREKGKKGGRKEGRKGETHMPTWYPSAAENFANAEVSLDE